MIFIAVKWRIRPEHADTWLDEVADFTVSDHPTSVVDSLRAATGPVSSP